MSWETYTLLYILAFIVATYLAMRSGRRYSLRDAVTHATDYAGVIKEAHGPITTFLYASYAAIIIWSIIYLALHWREFGVLG